MHFYRELDLAQLPMMNSSFPRYLKRTLCVALAVGVTSSCYLFKSPEKMISEKRQLLEGEFQGELLRQQRGTVDGKLKLDWNQALEKMYMENPSLL